MVEILKVYDAFTGVPYILRKEINLFISNTKTINGSFQVL